MRPILLVAILLMLAAFSGCSPRPGAELPRKGDEIVVCGRLFHTGAPVVLWTDPGGYDAYRTEKRFAPWSKSAWQAPAKKGDSPASPNRYSMRFAPNETTPNLDALTAEQFEQVRGGGWNLDLLQQKIDQFVLHYDVAGTSRQCFRTLHDSRGLSVHFMLDIDGTIYQTMDVKERAWHATIANDRSVGVEIANIGAYGPGEKDPFARWYERVFLPGKDGTTGNPSRVRITIPPDLGDGGVRTPDFVGYTDRPVMILGFVQGRQLRQYDLTPEQYRSLTKLAAALHSVLPRIELDYPRDENGHLVTHTLTKEQWSDFHGVLGHYHIQDNKSDPGPALQWDRVINGARHELGMKRLPPGAPPLVPDTRPEQSASGVPPAPAAPTETPPHE